jgi:hypothetical protein
MQEKSPDRSPDLVSKRELTRRMVRNMEKVWTADLHTR